MDQKLGSAALKDNWQNIIKRKKVDLKQTKLTNRKYIYVNARQETETVNQKLKRQNVIRLHTNL